MKKTNSETKVSSKNLYGLFIYHDENGHAYYYDIFTRKYYLITDNQIQKYLVYSLRFALGIVTAFILRFSVNLNINFCILAGLTVYVVLFILFRKNFLAVLNSAKNIKKLKRDNYIVRTASGMEYWRIISLNLIALLIVFLCMYYLKNMTYTNTNLVVYSLIIVIAVIYFVVNIVAIVYKKIHNL